MDSKGMQELNLNEMDQVRGGKGDSNLSDGKCPGCRKQLEHIEGSEYWCTNERCWAYHIRKSLTIIA